MTRGREANHAFVATDGLGGTDGHGPTHSTSSADEAADVLAAALARSGAQDAAHTARDNARTRTVEAARHAAEQAAREAAEPFVPAEHAARIALLTQRQDQRDRLTREQGEYRRVAGEARAELARTSRLRPARRRELTEAVSRHGGALDATFPALAALEGEIYGLTRQVAADARQREPEDRARAARAARAARSSDRGEAVLAPAVDVGAWRRSVGRPAGARWRLDEEQAQASRASRAREHDRTRSRDDAPGLGI
ncbi:MAG: hypothetical protein ACT4QF_03450 [Sporichthyaceae bacterium]